jgi:hypothetical protein
MAHEEIQIIQLPDRQVEIRVSPFSAQLDTDLLLQIDYSNLLGENLTFPVFLNKVGALRAEVEELIALTKHELKVHTARTTETFRQKLTMQELVKESKDGEKTFKQVKPTIAEVDNAVTTHPDTISLERKLLHLQKQFGIVDSLYWSAKSKDQKLNKFLERVVPEGHQLESLLEGKINDVMLRFRNPVGVRGQ